MRAWALPFVLIVAGCLSQPDTDPTPTPTPTPAVTLDIMSLTSSAFEDGGDIPRENSCDGEGASPPLTLAGAGNASTLAIIAEDPDVPTPIAPQRTITHWVLWNAAIVNGSVEFPEGALPAGAIEGEDGWRPPCPPQGSPAHRYVFRAYAVGGAFALEEGASRAELEEALEGNVLAEAELTGMYARAIVG